MKKVLYIEIDEEVTSVYDRAKKLPQRDIYLVVPRKAILFQSIVNLKILKSKLAKERKRIFLVTNDTVGMHLAEQAGIPVQTKVETEVMKAPEDTALKMRIEPIQARRNEVTKDQPRRSVEKKITIGELIREFRESKKKKEKGADLTTLQNYIKPSRRFAVFVLLFSMGLFFLISYIALPGATVYIKPRFDTLEYAVNITLADKRKNQTLLSRSEPHVIASEEIETVTKQTKIFNTTSKQFDGVNAQGFITIYNSASEEWPLKKETRFQTEDGLVFRIQEGVFVPPTTLDEQGNEVLGEYRVAVVADPFDIYADPIGERGNIGPSHFIIPGLTKYNQEIIWGESREPMEGGVTRYQKVVMEEDIESAKKQIEENLSLIAKEDLETHLKELNYLNNSNLVLLADEHYLKTELLELRVSEELEGSPKDKFEVFAQIRTLGVAYDFDQLFAILKKELKTRAHPDMRVRDDSISPNSLTFEPVDEDEVLGQIKLNVSIKGIQEYVIESSLEAGHQFANKKVREKILGMSLEEAENYVANLPEVDEVEIKLWPFWASRVPRIADNIEVRLMEN